MLCLLLDPSGQACAYAPNPGPWRTHIDLEHSTCYNMSNHWNGLTDGRTKYVYRAWRGDEQARAPRAPRPAPRAPRPAPRPDPTPL